MNTKKISRFFVKYWDPQYDIRKFPVDFYREHLNGARNAGHPEQLKKHLIALLNWKDGKAHKFKENGQNHAKPNIVDPILDLANTSFANFAQLFCKLVQAGENDEIAIDNLRAILSGQMWKETTVVIPAFILHIARPDWLPIIDQHTVRAFLKMDKGMVVKKPNITWPLWFDYRQFFQEAVFESGYYHSEEERCKVDRALFAYGKSLKDSSSSKHKPKPKKRHQSSHFSLHQATNTSRHQGEVNLKNSFEDVFYNVKKRGEFIARTEAGTNFKTKATFNVRGIYSGEATIRFFQDSKEYSRAYKCCWGHYYNHYGQRIGMYCQALDAAISALLRRP
jgi:hypothetical protein